MKDAFEIFSFLTGLACLIQTLELLGTRRLYHAAGPWSLNTISIGFESAPWVLRQVLLWLFRARVLDGLLLLRLGAALGILLQFHHWAPWAVLVFSQAVISWRWFGSQNGGSDSMAMIVLTGGLVISVGHSYDAEILIRCGWAWIAVQSVLSYFVAGVVKSRSRDWWRGTALREHLQGSAYLVPRSICLVNLPSFVWVLASAALIVWELSWVLLFFVNHDDLSAMSVWILSGIIFHFLVAVIMGLNRFFWFWIATYPALFVVFVKQFYI